MSCHSHLLLLQAQSAKGFISILYKSETLV